VADITQHAAQHLDMLTTSDIHAGLVPTFCMYVWCCEHIQVLCCMLWLTVRCMQQLHQEPRFKSETGSQRVL
jgi:hypothetical protein